MEDAQNDSDPGLTDPGSTTTPTTHQQDVYVSLFFILAALWRRLTQNTDLVHTARLTP